MAAVPGDADCFCGGGADLKSVYRCFCMDLQCKVNGKIHIGVLPPPLGGVSVYLYRLRKLHPEDDFIDPRFISICALINIMLTTTREIVLEGINWRQLFLLRLVKCFRSNKYSVVLHGRGWLNDINLAGFFKKKIMIFSLKGCCSIGVVGNHMKDELVEVLPLYEGEIIVRDAFLPPPLEDEPKILATYPDEMRNFMEVQRPLIVANAFQLADWNGIDLYGLDMCIELIHRLKKEYPSVGLLFALANEQYRPDYYAKMRGLIVDYGLQRNVYFLTDQHELWPILKDCDVMVRPTCTDGYGVSVAEALYFNRPAVASDVCNRSDGCVVFRNRDMDDFEMKVCQVLERGK